jgi:hypothetical protein
MQESTGTEAPKKGGRGPAMLVMWNGELYKVTRKAYRQILLRIATKGGMDEDTATKKLGSKVGAAQIDLNTLDQDAALEQLDEYI